MYCSNCGTRNEPAAVYCVRCGQRVGAPGPAVAAGSIDPYNGHRHGPEAEIRSMPASLTFRSGPWAGERRELGGGAPSIIGRSPESTVHIEHPSISRQHARLSQQPGGWVIEDLRSRNGTWLNGEPVTSPRPLRHGDVLRLGDIEAQFHWPESTTPPPPGPTAAHVPPGAERPDELVLADGQALPLTGTVIEVGRSPSSGIVLDDITISRAHARLQRLPEGWLLTDLGSSNGTQVNGQRVNAPVLLHEGDAIAFGRLVLTFHLGSGGPAPAQRTLLVQAQGAGFVVDGSIQRAADVLPPRPLGPPLIVLQNLYKSYRTSAGEQQVLRGVSLTINAGEFVAIVGPSGCGKSTLLNVITGIDRPDNGQVSIAGQDVLRMSTDALARWRGRNVGIVFQFFQLLPTLTVLENVMLPMAFCNTYRGGREARALECLRLVGMEHMARRLPSALSGGQQQRIAIARALANDPALLVGDEPTGNLDSKTSQQMFELFTQLVASGKTMLMVTHDPEIARSIPRRVEMLDGLIVQAN